MSNWADIRADLAALTGGWVGMEKFMVWLAGVAGVLYVVGPLAGCAHVAVLGGVVMVPVLMAVAGRGIAGAVRRLRERHRPRSAPPGSSSASAGCLAEGAAAR